MCRYLLCTTRLSFSNAKAMGKKMTRTEELQKLEAMRDFFVGMSDEDFVDYLYQNSPSFRKDFDTVIADPVPVIFDTVAQQSLQKIAYTQTIEALDNKSRFTENGDSLCLAAA